VSTRSVFDDTPGTLHIAVHQDYIIIEMPSLLSLLWWRMTGFGLKLLPVIPYQSRYIKEFRMTLPKTRHIYSAVAKALDAWGDRQHINARSHLGKLLGFRGDNAGIQLSNMLNSTTYNPASPKRLSVDHLDVMLCELDDMAQAKILSALVEEYGFTLNRVGTIKAKPFDLMSMFGAILKLDKQHGTIARAIDKALDDGNIDEIETKEIREHIDDFRRMLREFEANMDEGVE